MKKVFVLDKIKAGMYKVRWAFLPTDIRRFIIGGQVCPPYRRKKEQNEKKLGN
jgi:hypothetical protein